MPKTTKDQGRYAARGVSSSKKEVHATVDNLDRGLFPGAFCKITEDYLTSNKKKCNVIHSDGSGTKSNVAYLHFQETGDASVFRGIAQDSIVMNVDDLLCVGVTDGVLLSSTVNRNARRFPGAALAELIQGTEDFLGTLREFGFGIQSGGGETADVGDLVGTVTVDSCATAVMDRDKVISGDKIKPGLAIIGISSAGQCNYESAPNSGIGSNGLTSARHDLLCPYYREKYPETYDATTDKELVYCGPYKLEDELPNANGMTVGEALLSPTRTYAPVVAKLLKEFPEDIRGLVHCSGGGQTKCLRFGKKVHFVKDSLMPLPPIFTAIQKASKSTWKEMYQVYNMGHRLEVFVPKSKVKKVLAAIESFGLDAQQIGHTEKSEKPDGQNHLTLFHGKRALKYAL
ncbi:AIR synthase-related protein [Cerasicoccus frondis]|uniref:AIR synthase-related protein n=1 Tax=Cerasicoccus frondis TaxID=490090 RepID=UPI0028529552|nr:AIR synthase-related protein [Cerasicoccus frondis]